MNRRKCEMRNSQKGENKMNIKSEVLMSRLNKQGYEVWFKYSVYLEQAISDENVLVKGMDKLLTNNLNDVDDKIKIYINDNYNRVISKPSIHDYGKIMNYCVGSFNEKKLTYISMNDLEQMNCNMYDVINFVDECNELDLIDNDIVECVLDFKEMKNRQHIIRFDNELCTKFNFAKINKRELLNILYQKLDNEYQNFINELKLKDSNEIIESSFERVYKQDINYTLQDMELDDSHLFKLLTRDYILDTLYRDWLECDFTINHILEESILDSLQCM